MIYLDHAAATPLDEAVLAAMQPYFTTQFYNPSATYQAGQSVHKALDVARAQIGFWLGCQPSEIIFTAGGTEANNLAVRGIMQQYLDANCVISSIEHDAILAPARQYRAREVAVGQDGRIDLAALAEAIDEQTVLISVMYANNEIGTIEPLRDIAQLIDSIKIERRAQARERPALPLYLHTDACQAANYLDLHVSRLGVDMMTLNGGKIYGPKQSGVLYVKGGLQLIPLIFGGGQERGLRSGTENVSAAIGMAAALDISQQLRHTETRRLQDLQQSFLNQLQRAIPTIQLNGSTKWRLPNNLHITIPGVDNERLLIQLDEAGIMAAAGSACSASNEESSHVLRAIGLDEAAARASLRLTLGRSSDVATLAQVVYSIASFV
jgi:cysteine desulfurase